MSLEKEALKKVFIDARTPKLFSKDTVSDELLKELYELIKLGPTSGNCSPSRYVFLKTNEEKEKLKVALAPGNIEKLLSAPVIVLSCIDPFFFNALPRIGSEPDLRDWFVRDVGMSEEVSMRNSSIQGGYLIIAARMLGLDVMPISGFDPILVEENLLKKEGWHINFIVGLGHSDPKVELGPRLPRLDFDEAAGLDSPMFDTNETALVFYGCASGGGQDNFVALVKQGVVLDEVRLPSLGLAQSISDKTYELLRRTQENPKIVSVVTGPGSFTGLRATISIAQGLSLGWNVPLVGASLYQAMFATIKSSGAELLDGLRVLHHARRGFVYSLSVNGVAEVIDFEKAASMNYGQVAGNAVDGELSIEILRTRYRNNKQSYPSHPNATSILEASIKNNISSGTVFPIYGEGARISKPKV